MRLKIVLAVILAAFLILGIVAGPQQTESSVYDLVGTAEAAIDLHGSSEGAAVAVLLALRFNFTPTQITAAIHDKTLTASGEIPGVTRGRSVEQSLGAGKVRLAAREGAAFLVAEVSAADIANGGTEFFAGVPAAEQKAWVAWVLSAGAVGHTTLDIKANMDSARARGQTVPEMVRKDGVELAVLRDGAGNYLEPKHEMDWPYKGKKQAFAIRITIRPGSRPKPAAAKSNSLRPQKLSIKLTVSDRSSPDWAISGYSADLRISNDGGRPRISGTYFVRLQDLGASDRIRFESLNGTLVERGHDLSFPVRVRLHSQHQRTVRVDGKNLAEGDERSPNAFTGTITKLWGSGSFTAGPAVLNWEVKGMKYTGEDQPSGTIILDPDGRKKMGEDADRMRGRARPPAKVNYAGQGSFNLNVINVNEIESDATFFVNVHPNGSVDGQISYNSVDIFSGRKVGPAKVMLMTGSYTVDKKGIGNLTATLENSQGTKFANAMTGTFDGTLMNLSAHIKETGVMPAETTLKATGLRRR